MSGSDTGTRRGMLVITTPQHSCDSVLQRFSADGMHVASVIDEEQLSNAARESDVVWESVLVYMANGEGINLLKRARESGVTAFAILASTHEEVVQHLQSKLYMTYDEMRVLAEVDIGTHPPKSVTRLIRMLRDANRMTASEGDMIEKMDKAIEQADDAINVARKVRRESNTAMISRSRLQNAEVANV